MAEPLSDLWSEVHNARRKAHAKHGENSIEAVEYWEPRWLPILIEEVGELAHELTYDRQRPQEGESELAAAIRTRAALRSEAIDILAVVSAFVDSIDREIARDQGVSA